MGTLAVTGAGCLVSGDLTTPVIDGADTVVCTDGVITAVGRAAELAGELAAAEQVLDAAGATVAPGLIDSHVHVTFGDYSPRQKAVDYLEGYLHGGVTRVISAGRCTSPDDRATGTGSRRWRWRRAPPSTTSGPAGCGSTPATCCSNRA